jgi:hypothetical protein
MTSREEFEKYHLDRYGKSKIEDWLTWDTENNCYAYASTDVIWDAWQEQQKKIDDLTEALDCSLDDVAYFKRHFDRLEAERGME